jgi:predicted ATPase
MQCFSYAAWALWYLGYPDQALKRADEALVLAKQLSSPFNLASAQAFAVMCHQFRREAQRIRELADAAIAFSTEQGFPAWATTVGILRGWALAEQGQEKEGIAQLRQGLAAWRAAGSEQARSHQLALLAEAYGKAGSRRKV